MKISINENEAGFHLDLDAETVSDAAFLARLGMNVVKRKISVTVTAGTANMWGSIWFLKNKNEIQTEIKGQH